MANFLEKVFGNVFGNKHEKDIKTIRPTIDRINEHFEGYKTLSNDELRGKTTEFKGRIRDHLAQIDRTIDELRQRTEGEMTVDAREEVFQQIDAETERRDEAIEEAMEEILPEAFAVMKETARRFAENSEISVQATELDQDLAAAGGDFVEIRGSSAVFKNQWTAAGTEVHWNMVHYDVQLIGGVVLHDGKIAEMQTGEGKTLVSTLPAYLNALAGEGVHIITVNDYLARRDCEWNGPLFNFLGLTVDCIDRYRPHSPERIAAYRADITYGTNNEFGFDYLRDNMVRTREELVQRKLHFAMIDEVDSVLVDDARTPLIISGPVDRSDEEQFYELKPRIQRLVDLQRKQATKDLTEAKKLIQQGNTGAKPGEGGFLLLRAHRALPKNKPLIKFLSEQGMRQVLQKTENIYLQDQAKEMPVVDEDLLFVIEEKQKSVELTDKGIEVITGAGEEKDFFVVPDVGAEIAEIDNGDLAPEEKTRRKDELMQDFAIKTERLHSIQQLLKAYTLFERDIEYVVMDDKVKIVDENTGRIMEGRRYSDGLHQAIEAKESVKVQEASQTMATVTLQNFFRMYHKLSGMTGTAETEAGEFWDIYELDVVVIPTNKPVIRDDRDDLVYKTTREKFNAIGDEIEQLTGAGRPVLVGTTNVEVSELISRLLKRRGIKHDVLNAKQHQREADIVLNAGQPGAVTIATNMAGRGTDIKITDAVKEAGGLAIIGSERHESRRIDRQLRGRAGRQGDPGSSQFFVSLEDSLMRLFGSERIAKVMDRFGYEEGEVIQHSIITKNIERAQRKVEENNFGIRKRLLEYDDVMNTQREVVYTKRRNALFGDRLALDIMNSFYDLCEELVALNKQAEDFEQFKLDLIRFFAHDSAITDDEFRSQRADELTARLFGEIEEHYSRKSERVRERALPVLRQIHRDRGETIKRVVIPYTDGQKGMSVVVPLETAVDKDGRNITTEFEKTVTLALIDDAWKDHLRQMDDLKKEVQNAQFEQKDPLLVYKLEAFELFKAMISDINRQIASFLFKADIHTKDPNDVRSADQPQRTNMDGMKTSRTDTSAAQQQQAAGAPAPQRKMEPVRTAPKVGRNEPCPCGSGKKYKHCHGKN